MCPWPAEPWMKPEPVSQELQASCKDDTKMPGLKAKSNREEGGRSYVLCGDPKRGKLRLVAAGAAGIGSCVLCPGVGWLQPPVRCSPSHTCPLPSPLFLRIWEVPPQPAGTAVVGECRVGVGSPRRERRIPSPGGGPPKGTLNVPPCPDLS